MARTAKQPKAEAAKPTEPQELELTIDLSELTFGDMEMALGFQDGNIDNMELMRFLNRVVVGGVRHIKIVDAPKVMDAVNKAFQSYGNPKN